jgi:hypothetical protein
MSTPAPSYPPGTQKSLAAVTPEAFPVCEPLQLLWFTIAALSPALPQAALLFFHVFLPDTRYSIY